MSNEFELRQMSSDVGQKRRAKRGLIEAEKERK